MQLASLSRRDNGNAETLEELLRRLRELCRLMAYVSALEPRPPTMMVMM